MFQKPMSSPQMMRMLGFPAVWATALPPAAITNAIVKSASSVRFAMLPPWGAAGGLRIVGPSFVELAGARMPKATPTTCEAARAGYAAQNGGSIVRYVHRSRLSAVRLRPPSTARPIRKKDPSNQAGDWSPLLRSRCRSRAPGLIDGPATGSRWGRRSCGRAARRAAPPTIPPCAPPGRASNPRACAPRPGRSRGSRRPGASGAPPGGASPLLSTTSTPQGSRIGTIRPICSSTGIARI